MKARAACACAAAALVALLTMLCGQRQTILTIGVFAGSNWGVSEQDSDTPFVQAAARFEAAHPGVSVTFISGVPREEYPEWLAKQILLGCEPDVYLVPESDLAPLVQLGALMPLDGRMAGEGGVEPAAYYPAAWQSGQIDGTPYALPYQCVPMTMCVNETLLAGRGIAVPDTDWTWGDFYRICQAVTLPAPDGKPGAYGCTDYTWAHAAVSNGVTVFDSAGRTCTFDDARVQDAILFAQTIESLNRALPHDSEAFRKGLAAFQPMLYSSYRADQPYMWKIQQYAGFNWTCLTMPAGPAGDNISEMSTLLLAMSARTDTPELSWELLRMMCADTVYQAGLSAQLASLSPLRAAAQQTAAVTAPIVQAMELAVARPTFGQYETAMQHADRVIDELLETNSDLDNGLLGLEREVTKILEQSSGFLSYSTGSNP